MKNIENNPAFAVVVLAFFLLLNFAVFLPIADYWYSKLVRQVKKRN
jgi:hypothetical protein